MRIQHTVNGNAAWGTGLLRYIVDWYTPYFAGYSFVIARDNEYEADRVSGQFTSPHVAASALVATYVYGNWLDQHFWNKLYNKAYTQEQPEETVYSQLEYFLRQQRPDQHAINRYISQSLANKTESFDMHPSLLDRLKALKSAGKLEQKPGPSASHVWLGNKHKRLLEHFNFLWTRDNRDQWRAFHAEANEAREEVARIKNLEPEARKDKDHWNQAWLTEQYCPQESALPLYQAYLQRIPDDADAQFSVGRILAHRNEADCVALLEKTVEVERLRLDAAELLWFYYQQQKDERHANYWRTVAESAYDANQLAIAELNQISMGDYFFQPRSLYADEAILQGILGNLSSHKKVKEVWLAQKDVEYYKDSPVYVLAVATKGFVLDEEELLQELYELSNSSYTAHIMLRQVDKKLFDKIQQDGRSVFKI